MAFISSYYPFVVYGKTKDITPQDPYAWEKTEIETQTIELPFTMDETREWLKSYGEGFIRLWNSIKCDDRLWEFYNIHPRSVLI